VAQHRHKREAPATTPRPSRIPRSVLVSAPLAVVATLSAVTMGVLAAEPATNDHLLASSSTAQPATGASADTVDDTSLRRRTETPTVSRSQIRTAAKAEAAARKKIAAAREDRRVNRKARQLAEKVDDAVWTTDVLNLWDGPSTKSSELTGCSVRVCSIQYSIFGVILSYSDGSLVRERRRERSLQVQLFAFR